MRTPLKSGQDASGIALQSVRYANEPIRYPRICREPCSSGTGAIVAAPTQNSPAMRASTTCGTPPPRGVSGAEDVGIDALQIVQRPLVAVTRNRRLLHHVEAAHFVESHDVIGVAVRIDNGVDASDAVRERLHAQVRRRVDEHRRPAVGLNQDGRARSFVARIGRAAGAALAADHRHAVRRARAQHEHPGRWRSRRDDSLFLALRLDEAEPQLVEDGVEQLPLLCREVAARLLFEQREDVDHLAGRLQIDRTRFGRAGLETIAEMHGRCGREREHEMTRS